MLFSDDVDGLSSGDRSRRTTSFGHSDQDDSNATFSKPRTMSADSVSGGGSSFNLIPSGFFQGLALQLPFRRKNAAKRSEDSVLPFHVSSNQNISDDSDTWEAIELVQFSHQVVVDPGNETGIGHQFRAVKLKNPTWCDRCGDFIWGLSKLSVRCKNCNYTCHERCQNLVTLDCKVLGDHNDKAESEEKDDFSIDGCSDEGNLSDSSSLEGVEIQGTETNSLSESDENIVDNSLAEKLEEFNRLQTQGLHMTMYDDGSTFRGFIRVHMNLCRPINVVSGTRPPSIYDIIYDEEETMRKTLTSFYLPRDTVKALHITSTTTTQEVIIALLKKFKVVDNPRKFALYESFLDSETDQMKLRRLQDHEQPLMMALTWGTSQIENRSFVLQENETGDILWDAFSMPELNNFLRILDMEEEEYLNQVKIKYKAMQETLEELMSQNKPST